MSRGVKQVRYEAQASQVEAAVMAGVSPNTWRQYENNREAVTEAKRTACDRALEKLEQRARERSAA
jgi:DNA-binding XRE family transcriptional regulator